MGEMKSNITLADGRSLDIARRVSELIHRQDSFSWNSVFGDHIKQGHAKEALDLFLQMQQQGISPDEVTFVLMLNVCAHQGNLEQGKMIHVFALNSGIRLNIYIRNALVDMYSKCGSIGVAQKVFEEMPNRNVVTCNALIGGYINCGLTNESFKLFEQMEHESIRPNQVTFVYVLKACASLGSLELGEQIHMRMLKSGLKVNVFMNNSLIDMYCKFGRISQAHQIFDQMPERDVVSWNCLTAGYAKYGPVKKVFKLFKDMIHDGVRPSEVTFLNLTNACATLENLGLGKWVHAQIVKLGEKQKINVWNSLIDMYAKCGSIKDAHQLFDKMSVRDLVSWNVMISGYVNQGPPEKSFELFRAIQREGLIPNQGTFVNILNACALSAALEKGCQIHRQVVENGLGSDAFVASALLDMYAKCGNLEEAFHVLREMPQRDVVSWNAMIAGYAQYGQGEKALQLLEQMQQEEVMPNQVTFLGVMSACSHAGLIHEGYELFGSMNQDHCMTATMEHYACMVDLLGRAGCLEGVMDFIKNMPSEPDNSVWVSVLNACRINGDAELAKHITDTYLNLEPKNIGNFVLLSNIYAAAGRWDDKAKVLNLMKEKGMRKKPGHSLILVNNQVHKFIVGDTSHPQMNKILEELERLNDQIKGMGYEPDKRFVLHDLEEEQKESFLLHHTEKLAIAFGLISIPYKMPIRIIKNLRVCGDCHTVAKFISKLAQRDIIMRDANRFHHFRDGFCSCGDYW